MFELCLDSACKWEIIEQHSGKTDYAQSVFGDMGLSILFWLQSGQFRLMRLINQASTLPAPAVGSTEEKWSPREFTIGGSGNAERKTLSLFMNIRGSDTSANPVPPEGDAWKVCPVPTDHTMSVLVDHRLLRRLVIMPALKECLTTTKSVKYPVWNESKDGGFVFSTWKIPGELTGGIYLWDGDIRSTHEPMADKLTKILSHNEKEIPPYDPPLQMKIDVDGGFRFEWLEAETIERGNCDIDWEIRKV